MRALLLIGAIVFHLASCGGNLNTKEAVRQGVIDHLSNRKKLDLNLSTMDIDITSVNFRSNEADAMVAFKPKGSPNAGMSMKYTLELKGNHWVVKDRPAGDANPHGGSGGGAGMNPHGGGAPPQEMPPGHPTVPTPQPGSPK